VVLICSRNQTVGYLKPLCLGVRSLRNGSPPVGGLRRLRRATLQKTVEKSTRATGEPIFQRHQGRQLASSIPGLKCLNQILRSSFAGFFKSFVQEILRNIQRLKTHSSNFFLEVIFTFNGSQGSSSIRLKIRDIQIEKRELETKDQTH
jgi:hypothetical protein